MFTEIFVFELRYHLRQPLFWISAFFFFLLTFLAITTDAVVLGGSIGKIHRNAPFVVMQMLLVMSVIGVFITTAFMASTVLRDYEHKVHEVFFSKPIKKRDYLLGRFFGALTVSTGVFMAVALAIVIGAAMPWLEPERVGSFALMPYLFSFGVLVIPNLFLTGSIFFSLATITRNMMYTYVGMVGMFAGYFVSSSLLSDVENEQTAALLDPFGGAAFGIATRYWTVAEKNSQVLALDASLISNRLLWLGLAMVIFAFTYRMFSFRAAPRGSTRKRKADSSPAAIEMPVLEPVSTLSSITPPARDFSLGNRLRQFTHACRMEVGAVARSLGFPVILAFGVLNMIGNSLAIDQLFGTPVHPVTHLMINILLSSFLFVFIILTFYSGEIVWRERSLNLSEVYDSLPIPNWIFWGSKLTALSFVLLALIASAALTGIGIQAYRGYFNFELGLYGQGMVLAIGVPLLLIGVLAIFLQVMSSNRYLGFLLMILYFISGPALSSLDFQHNLYQYASAPGAPYSDMNGFGHFVAPQFWFYLYWSFFAVLLVGFIHLFWRRGSEEGWRLRFKIARGRLTRPVTINMVGALLAFLVTGAWIFYNTNVLNEYVPGDLQERRLARYEKDYKQFEGIAQPRIVDVYADVDIFPESRSVDIDGRYTLRNKTAETIGQIHVTLTPSVTIRKLGLPAASLDTQDEELGYYIYDLGAPLRPGEELELTFELAIENNGFLNHGSNTSVVENGTFFNSGQYFPHIGYSRNFEMGDPNDRRKYGLPAVQRMPSIDDEAGRSRNYISSESDWMNFETVVSTSPDQIALAPGYLQREWTEDDRRYFHYKMDAPILGFFSYLSARYEVKRDEWEGVAIEIYHHPGHEYNVDRMVDGVKKSLDYFTTEFGPYQHSQVRILEFPRYARFAQSFPNTIPFSESIGFIAKLDEEEEEAIDYVFYVTAHEVAHQWWAHQVIGGFVQGATVMSETMSQYSALMVMEREYGREKMRRFLKYELDAYLRGRGGELIEELPLMLVENQPYIHYRKGSLVMYALRDAIGEERLNRALARYVEAVKFQEPPYTTSREFLSYIAEEVPEEERSLLVDLFENITLYESRAASASYEERPDGKYLVRLTIEAQKYRADGEGVETEVAVDDLMDVAVFGEKEEGGPPEGKVLILEKKRINAKELVFELVVDEKPTKAGVDPFNKLIDRNPENNVTNVEAGT